MTQPEARRNPFEGVTDYFSELGRSFVIALPELFIPFGVILALASGIGLPEVAAPSTVHCDHLIQAKVGANIDDDIRRFAGEVAKVVLARDLEARTEQPLDVRWPLRRLAAALNDIDVEVVRGRPYVASRVAGDGRCGR